MLHGDTGQMVGGEVGGGAYSGNADMDDVAIYSGVLSADVAEEIARRLESGPLIKNAPEDITIWQMAKRLGQVVENRFRSRKGPFSAIPFGADAQDARSRFAVLDVGLAPRGGWKDKASQMAGEMKRLANIIQAW